MVHDRQCIQLDNSLNIPDDYSLCEQINEEEEDNESDSIDTNIKSYDDVKEDFEKIHCKIMQNYPRIFGSFPAKSNFIYFIEG